MATSGLTPGPRELINADGDSFGAELADVEAVLAHLPNDERRAYRDRNATAIARHPASQLLIVAGPGSGKSYLFLERIRYWVEEYGEPHIYVSTFVRKLVDDLLNEVAVKLDPGVKNRVDGSTLHSLARSILERSSGTSDLPLDPYIKVIAGDRWERVVWRDVLAFHAGLSGYSHRDLRAQFQEDELSDEGEWLELRATYDRLRSFYNAVGFADMIVSARTAVEENPELVEHPFWIVDEFQDLNRAEEHLIRALTREATGVLIAGDDEQALYQQMKGATPEIIVAYYEDHEFVNAMLPYCSRCSYYICLAASAFIDHHRGDDAIAKSYLPLEADPERVKVQIILTAAPRTAVAYVARFLDDHAEELKAHADAMEAGAETDPFLLILSPETEAGFLQKATEELFDLVSAWGSKGLHRSQDYWNVVDFCMAAWRPDNFTVRKVLDHDGVSVDDVHELIVTAFGEDKSLVELDSELLSRIMFECHEVAAVVEAEDTGADEKAARCAELVSAVSDVGRLARELDAHPISKGGAADEGDARVEGAPTLSPVEVLSMIGAKGLSAKHVIVLGCDEQNMPRTTPLEFYVALSRARETLHLVTSLGARGATAAHPYIYDIPEEYCEYVAFKQSGVEKLAGQQGFRKKLRVLTRHRRG
jgi:superfamily I DNA/RNA helicase